MQKLLFLFMVLLSSSLCHITLAMESKQLASEKIIPITNQNQQWINKLIKNEQQITNLIKIAIGCLGVSYHFISSDKYFYIAPLSFATSVSIFTWAWLKYYETKVLEALIKR